MRMNSNGGKSAKSLNDLFMGELADMYDAEKRLVKALPKLAKKAHSEELTDALETHLAQTQDQVLKLERVFASFDAKPKGKKCAAMVGLLEEGDEILEEYAGSPAADAAIISAGQKVEHYEIASYGCLREWAGLLDNDEAATLLGEILEEEKAADEKLTEVGRSIANEEAESGNGNGGMQGLFDEEPAGRSTGRRTASRSQGAASTGRRSASGRR